MKPFRERNPVVIGFVSLVALGLLLTAALRADDLPLIGGGDTYRAAFTESGGLKKGDEVRIAGVRVGKVDEVALDDGHVVATFKVDRGEAFGPDTRAAIKVKTLLGAMFLSLEPAGAGQLEEGSTIPVERTSSPYDVVEAFEGLADTTDRIDTDQLAGVADHAGRPDPQHPRGVPRGPRRRHPALGQRRRQGRADQRRCWSTSTRSPGCSTSATRTSSR